MKKTKFLLLSLLFIVVALTGCGTKNTKESTQQDKIVLGSVGSDAEIWKHLAKSEVAKKAGVTIEVKEFAHGMELNKALAEGEVEVNAFQSFGYMKIFNKDSKADLVPLALTYYEPMGLYSKKLKSLKELPDGAIIAIANDPAIGIRSLRLVEQAGLIKLKKV